MKARLLAISLLTPFLWACSGDTQAARPADIDHVKEELGEAWDALEGYAYGQRTELEQQLEERLAAWEQRIDELASKAGDEATARIQELEQRRERLVEEISRLGESGEDAWGEIRAGIMESMKSLERSLADARSELDQGPR